MKLFDVRQENPQSRQPKYFNYMKALRTRGEQRTRRQRRIRAQVHGTVTRPRLCVFRSLRYLSAQLIDDASGKTLLSAHSKTTTLTGDVGDRIGKQADAYRLGLEIARLAKEQQITKVVFDRAGYRYHGRVRAVADGAREGGLEF